MNACDLGIPKGHLDSGVEYSLAHRAYWTLRRKCNARGLTVKTARLPSVRVDSDLRQSAEAVLREDKSLSSFMEQSLRD